MKKQLNQLRRFFARTSARRLNAATAQDAIPSSYDDESDTRLSGAFVIVLILHVVALIGVFAFSRIRDKNPITPHSPATPASAAAVPAIAPPDTGAQFPPAESPRVEDTASKLPPEPDLPPLPAFSGNKIHVVKVGENLTRIALAYGIQPADIVAANKLKSQDDIKAGKELVIPAVTSTPPAPAAKTAARTDVKSTPPTKTRPSTYTIKKGDTLTKISNEFGIPYAELTKFNNIKDPKKIQPGQTLKLPKKN